VQEAFLGRFFDMNSKLNRHPGPVVEAALRERRGHRRLSVRLALVVRLGASETAGAVMERTVTRNISPGDMCFESRLTSRMRVGDRLDADIELPVEGATIFSERRLQARGRVVRVDPSGQDGAPGSAAVVFEGPPAFHSADV
jgi:hypothetical protein